MVVVEIIAVWLKDAKGFLGRLLTNSGYASHGEGTALVPLFKLQRDFDLGYRSTDEVVNDLEPIGNLPLHLVTRPSRQRSHCNRVSSRL